MRQRSYCKYFYPHHYMFAPLISSLNATKHDWTLGSAPEKPMISRNFKIDTENQRLRLDNGQVMYYGYWDKSSPLTIHCEVEITSSTSLDQFFGIYPISETRHEGLMISGREGKRIGIATSWINWLEIPFDYVNRKLFFSFSFCYHSEKKAIDFAIYVDGSKVYGELDRDASRWETPNSAHVNYYSIGNSYSGNNPYGFFRNFSITQLMTDEEVLLYAQMLYP